MYLDFLVEVPDEKGKITTKKKGDAIYVNYEVGREYYPDRQYTIPKRVIIGKLSKADKGMMVPNQNFLTYFPEVELPEEKQITDVVQEEGQLILRFSDGSSEILEQNSCIRWFDYDRIEEPVNLRYRETGDYLYVSTDGRMRQSLKALMINEKIPAEKRGRMPLVASGSEILWIPGLRTGERCRIGQETRRLLKLMVHGD